MDEKYIYPSRTKQIPSSKELTHPVMDTATCGDQNLDVFATNKDENNAIPLGEDSRDRS